MKNRGATFPQQRVRLPFSKFLAPNTLQRSEAPPLALTREQPDFHSGRQQEMLYDLA